MMPPKLQIRDKKRGPKRVQSNKQVIPRLEVSQMEDMLKKS